MNRFVDVMEGLRKRALSEKMLKTLEQIDALGDVPEEGRKTRHIRLPYSSSPRSFDEPWK